MNVPAKFLTIAVMAGLCAAAAQGHDDIAWKAEREARFLAVKASHPPQDATIATITLETARLASLQPKQSGPRLERPPVVLRTSAEPVVVFDTAVAPRMVVVPAGEFTMGSPPSEPGHRPDEGRHRVRIVRPFAVSMFPVTFGEYSWFVHATGHKPAVDCHPSAAPRSTVDLGDWRNPGFAQTPRSPATCIAYQDAVAYARWLSTLTGARYRLLSDREYEYAARAGTTTAYWWGDEFRAGCKVVNAADACDAFTFTMPLDQSKANGFGLFDTAGNVSSWTSDCWRGDCNVYVVRGGSWASPPSDLRSAARTGGGIGDAVTDRGFRIARDL